VSDLRKTKDDCLPIKLVNVAATPAALETITDFNLLKKIKATMESMLEDAQKS